MTLSSNFMEGMTEVIIDNNVQCKRRLPTWMQNNATTKKENCGNFDGKFSTSEIIEGTQNALSGHESMSGEFDVALLKKKDPENREKVLKKHIRKPKRCDGSEVSTHHFVGSKRTVENDTIGMTDDDDAEFMSGEIDAAQVEKKGPKNKEKISKKHTGKPNQCDGSEESTRNFVRNKIKIGEDIDGNKAELAVEDLISIAEEFLTADKIKQPVQYVASTSKSFESNSVPMSSHITPEEKPNGAIRSCQIISKCNQTSSLHLNTNQTAESSSISSNKLIQSGDVAQDMLELFLGPLLKKAPSQEYDQI